MRANDGTQYARLPTLPTDRGVEGRPTRLAVLAYFLDRFGVPATRFEGHSFWEKGAGRIWAFAGALETPQDVETLGLPILRTRQEHWKPTTVGVRRFCEDATRNVITLDRPAAACFMAGEDQSVSWDGDWGYLIVAHIVAGRREPIGVGLYVHGELQSMIPKSDRRALSETRYSGAP
ncbi:MAG: hypothetical protein ABEJ35_00145 [Halobacteriaceae archaeon]